MFKLFHSHRLALAGADRPLDRQRFFNPWFHRGRGFGGGEFGGGRDRWGGHDRGGPFGGGGWGDERRTRRGDIKFILLELLAERPRHGYDLIKELELRHGGFRRPSPGSVYPTLQMLEDGGYLTSASEGGKRVYTITDEGRQLLTERTQNTASGSPWEAFSPFGLGKSDDLIALRAVAGELASAVMQVARTGDSERINRVKTLLEQVRREIYTILAEK